MGRRWPSFKAPEHVLYFDFRRLSALMQRAGLTDVRRLPYPHAFPLGLITAKFGFTMPPSLGRFKVWVPATTVAAYGRVSNRSTEAGQQLISVVNPKRASHSFRSFCPFFAKALTCSALLAAGPQLSEQCNLPYELVVVDDGSPDDTWRVIQRSETSCTIRALRLSRNFGKESALCAGLEHARGDAVIVMDADGQHPPSLILRYGAPMAKFWSRHCGSG